MLKDKVQELITKKHEGAYWDFKQQWYSNNADMLHDILCMSNNLDFCDAYIIIGVSDDGTVIGIDDNAHDVRNTQMITNFLMSLRFVGDRIPNIEVSRVLTNNKNIDIIHIKRDNYIHQLLQKYSDSHKQVGCGIYVRSNDSNTPIDKTASEEELKRLFEHEHGLDLTAEGRASMLLQEIDQWKAVDDKDGIYYHTLHPEYTIALEKDPWENEDFLCKIWPSRSRPWDMAKIKYNGTTIRSIPYTSLDNANMCAVAPNIEYVQIKNDVTNYFRYYYVIENSIENYLHNFLLRITNTVENRWIYYKKWLAHVILFDNKQEKLRFDDYLSTIPNRLQRRFDMTLDLRDLSEHWTKNDSDDFRSTIAIKSLFTEYKNALAASSLYGNTVENIPINTICATVTPPAKIQVKNYLPNGTYPIIDQGDNKVAGYTDNIDVTLTGKYVLFGDHTCKLQLINGTFAQGADGLKILKINENIADTLYAYYAMKSLNYKSKRYKRHWQDFKEEKILVPCPALQCDIFRFLSALDNKIELNDKINKKLNELARLIYNYWFVQFDFPDEHGRPYRASGGKMVYNDLLKRGIPEGWKVSPLTNNPKISLIKPGINKFDSPKFYLATAEVRGDNISTTPPMVDYNNRESRANMQPIPNSIWFAKMKDSVKHIYVGEYSKDLLANYIFSTGFAGLKTDSIMLPYLISYINQSDFEDKKDQLSHGATQKAVNNTDIALFDIVVPPDNVLQMHADITSNIYGLIDNNRRESQQLTQLRDWLLPMLINGQVVVK